MELDFSQTTNFPILVIDAYPLSSFICGAFYHVKSFTFPRDSFQAIPSLFHSSVLEPTCYNIFMETSIFSNLVWQVLYIILSFKNILVILINLFIQMKFRI